MSERRCREFDLAPRRTRPLALWNPLDYLVLLYWVLFFPQALRWYVQTLGLAEHRQIDRGLTWRALREDPLQGRLVLQGLLLVFIIAGLTMWGMPWLEVPVRGADVVVGVAIGVAVGMAGGVAFGVGVGIAFGVAFGITGGVAGGMTFGVTVGVAGGVAFGLAVGVAEGVIGSGKPGVDVLVTRSLAVGVAEGVIGGVARGMAFGMAAGVAGGLVGGLVGSVAGGLAFGVTASLVNLDLFGWLLFPFFRFGRGIGALSRRTWIPIPGLQDALVRRMENDWDEGVEDVCRVLAYSLQFIPAIRAVNAALACSRPELVLQRAAVLARAPFHWALLRYGTESLGNALRARVARGFSMLTPRKWRDAWQARYVSSPRLDTAARSACAGFWAWHKRDAVAAAEAFRQVRDLPFGRELSGIADALERGLSAETLDELVNWHVCTAWLETLPEQHLRSGTVAALATLRDAAVEVRKAQMTGAPLNRTTALGRAGALLQGLIEHSAESFPAPEWSLVRAMAETWRDLVVKAGGIAGEEVERQRVLNPYTGYAGQPVHPPVFVGRTGAIGEIHRHWAHSEDPPVIVLYGHRRMGKTSILLNIEAALSEGSLLVYLDAQGILADHSGQFLFDVAEAVHTRTIRAGLDPGPSPTEDDYDTLGRASRKLKALLARLAPQMAESRRLILAFDEFEVIQDRIRDGCIDASVLGYLRSLNQTHRWLALIFGGLHTMSEMGNDYRTAFYAQTEHVRVSYLSRVDSLHLVIQPHPDFALEYDDVLCEELYRLTYGQPFLLQRLCWTMVERWNDRFERERGTPSRVLTLDDLAPVLDDELFAATAYYFEGVWNNVSPAEQALMTVLATREEPWPLAALEAAFAYAGDDLAPVVQGLHHHDVVVVDAGHITYASELLRRWIERRNNARTESRGARAPAQASA